MATPTLILVNDCTATTTFDYLPSVGAPGSVSLDPGETQSIPLPGAGFVTVTNMTTGDSIGVSLDPVPTATVTLRPGLTPGSCVLGDGPIPIQVTNTCSGDTTVSLQERDPATGGVVSTTSQTIPVGGSTLFYVRSDTNVLVAGPGNVLGPLRPAINPAARFLTLTTIDGVCTLILTPGTSTITITNRCRFDSVVTISDVAGGVVIPGLTTTLVIPAGTAVTYTFQSIATALARVCLGGRCVTVGPGGRVTLVETSGFCAPIVGDPVVCAVAPRCPVRCR